MTVFFAFGESTAEMVNLDLWLKANINWKQFEGQGKLLALPMGPSAPIFWYRKDLFDKYGIKVPNTYEEVITMKKKLQEAMEKDGLKDIYAFTTRAKRGVGKNTWTTTIYSWFHY